MRKTWLTKDEKIELLEEQVTKYKFLFDKAQSMLDMDEIKRLRSLCCKYAKQIKQLEEMRGIKWNPNPTDLPIM